MQDIIRAVLHHAQDILSKKSILEYTDGNNILQNTEPFKLMLRSVSIVS